MTEEVMASSRVNYMEGLKDGLNVIKHGERGFMDIYVSNGVIINMTLFNCKVSKKETHTVQKGMHWVDLKIKNDEGFDYRYTKVEGEQE